MSGEDMVLWNVVDTHLDEAEFLLEQWLAALRSPRFSLVLLQKTIEPRLVAHLDALAVGGAAVADRTLWPVLAEDSEAPPLRIAAAALALVLEPESEAGARLIDLLRATENGALREGLRRAFEVCARSDVDEPLRLALYATDAPAAQAALLEILSRRQVDPGPILARLLGSADPALHGAALDACAAANADSNEQPAQDRFAADAPALRVAALRAALVWNRAWAWKACLAEARAGSAFAMLAVGLLGGPSELEILVAALRSPARRAHALYALGFSGRAEAVEACLPLLDDPDEAIAKLAAEAVAAITDLRADEPPIARLSKHAADELPPLEEDLPVALTPDPADELGLVDASKVRAWWAERRPSYGPDLRYLRGKPMSPASLTEALAQGPLRRSGPLAWEIAVRGGARARVLAPRLASAPPVVPTDLSLQRSPVWR